jgi:hypothetical protein
MLPTSVQFRPLPGYRLAGQFRLTRTPRRRPLSCTAGGPTRPTPQDIAFRTLAGRGETGQLAAAAASLARATANPFIPWFRARLEALTR